MEKLDPTRADILIEGLSLEEIAYVPWPDARNQALISGNGCATARAMCATEAIVTEDSW